MTRPDEIYETGYDEFPARVKALLAISIPFAGGMLVGWLIRGWFF